jgi:CubicO group peptidase (beta-lactamase class C family)
MKFCPQFAGFLLFASLPVLCTNAASLPNALPIASATVGAATVDTPGTTVDGNSFIVPAEWSTMTKGPAVILTAPEGGSRIALVDVTARDADAATAAAWAVFDAKARWPLKQAIDRPIRNGWEQIRSYRYEIAANEQRVVNALAMRRGANWTVAIIDMAHNIAEKRDGQIELVFGRLMPKGYSRETFAGRTAHVLDATRIEALKQFVEDARQQFDVPGTAIGIVQDGKVVLAEGFGVRERGKPDKVDADTLFMIASNTKPLTTLMLAKLIDAGKFTWDTPVTQVLPTFKLGDADVTRQVQMKHLVCACTGMPRQDMETTFNSEGATPASVMTTLATMKPTSKFGELYQYSNIMASAAGYAGGHALHPQRELGAAYDAAMQSLVFDPLGMASTTFDFKHAQRGNHASPHSRDVEGRTVLTGMDLNYTDIAGRPNGGAWSNVHDMLRYVQMELDKGALPDGTRYISEAPLLARRVQQVAKGDNVGYGMGVKIDRSSGTTLHHHGGTAFGYVSDVLWLPEHGVGAVILTNTDEGGIVLRSLFRRRLMEVLFDGNPEAVANIAVQSKRMKEESAVDRSSLTVPADPSTVQALAARYRSTELGDLRVSRKGSTVWFDFGDWRSEMASRRDAEGTVSLVTISPGMNGWLKFVVADKGSERVLILRDAQHEYRFSAGQ